MPFGDHVQPDASRAGQPSTPTRPSVVAQAVGSELGVEPRDMDSPTFSPATPEEYTQSRLQTFKTEEFLQHPHNEHYIMNKCKRKRSTVLPNAPRGWTFKELLEPLHEFQFSTVLPIMSWLPGMLAGPAPLQSVLRDIMCGVTVAAIVVPQGMAYSMLAGLPPVYGLYTAMLPPLAYLVFGSCLHLSVGPFALISMLTYQGVVNVVPDPYKDPEAAVAAAGVIALFSGCLLILMGIMRLGFIATFLSDSVLSGYTTAVSLIIPLSQMQYAFQVNPKSDTSFFGNLKCLLEVIVTDGANVYAMVFFFASVISILALQALNRSKRFPQLQRTPLPAELIVVICATAACKFFGVAAQPELPDGVTVLGTIPSGLPPIAFPDVRRFDFHKIVPSVLMVSLMSYITSMSVARTFGRKFGYEVDNNQELLALGCANVFGSTCASFPASASLSRTAVAANVGTATPAHGLWSTVVLTLVLLYLSPLLKTLPQAVLAAIVVIAFKSLLQNGFSEVWMSWRISLSDFLMWNVAFLSTLSTDVTSGIAIAVAADIFYLVWCITQPNHAVLGRLDGTERLYRNRRHFTEARAITGVLIFRFEAPLHFANREVFVTRLLKELHLADNELVKDPTSGNKRVRAVVVDLSPMSHIDITAVRALERLCMALSERSTRLVLAHCRYRCYKKLSGMGIFREGEDESLASAGRQHDVWCFSDLHDAVRFAERRLQMPGPQPEHDQAELEADLETATVSTE